jgi:hypothetical protein
MAIRNSEIEPALWIQAEAISETATLTRQALSTRHKDSNHR